MALTKPAWERRYVLKVFITDVLIIVASVLIAQVSKFGLMWDYPDIPVGKHSYFSINYTLLSIGLIVGWLVFLQFFETRDYKILGAGPGEYKRLVTATFSAFGVLSILAFVFKSPVGRGYLLIAFPLGLLLLLISRWLWRKRLHRQRRLGLNSYRTLIAGDRHKSAVVGKQIVGSFYSGFNLVGAITTHGKKPDLVEGVPVFGDFSKLLEMIDTHNIEVLIMTGTDEVSPEDLRQFGWDLESRGVQLIVAASLTDIAGPRIHARPVSGLPLIQIDYPEFRGRKYVTKRVFDLALASLMLVLLSPLLLVLTLIVWFGSKGPVIFRQPRVGLDGQKFQMYKFRSMVVDAEDQLPGLLDQSDGNEILFKIKNDPRVTKNGRWMRKYSLDELPQLVNVIKGEMSLVGPRPPLPNEVEAYQDWAYRRLLVKPGITGLWQVSGRSDLSWEDSIRLDLYYVENWSITEDLLLLAKTVRTILFPVGSY